MEEVSASLAAAKEISRDAAKVAAHAKLHSWCCVFSSLLFKAQAISRESVKAQELTLKVILSFWEIIAWHTCRLQVFVLLTRHQTEQQDQSLRAQCVALRGTLSTGWTGNSALITQHNGQKGSGERLSESVGVCRTWSCNITALIDKVKKKCWLVVFATSLLDHLSH